MTTNGSNVTRAELAAHLQPMREDISEVKADVKTLLSAQASFSAVDRYRRWVIGLTITCLSGIIASVATLTWLAVGG